MAEYLHRVPLVRLDAEALRIRLDAAIDVQGDLVLEGYDLGSRVEELLGDSDYEYWLRVQAWHLGEVFDELLVDLFPAPADREAWLRAAGAAGTKERPPEVLLLLLQEAFSNGRFSSDSEFRAWLDERRIASEFSSWV